MTIAELNNISQGDNNQLTQVLLNLDSSLIEEKYSIKEKMSEELTKNVVILFQTYILATHQVRYKKVKTLHNRDDGECYRRFLSETSRANSRNPKDNNSKGKKP